MGANKIADQQTLNTPHQIKLDIKSQILPGGTKIIYENTGFRQVACAINLPAAIDSLDPKLNGLADRYSAYTIAQLILMDLINFPKIIGAVSFVPENYSSRKPK